MARAPAATTDFEDLRTEWRRLFGEGFGTFLLVLAASGASVVDAATRGEVGRVAAVTAPGLTVFAVILFMGAVSGAHLNPAITLAFALRGDFRWRRVPGYMLAQLTGAVAAAGVVAALFGNRGAGGSTVPGPGFTDLQAVVVEMLLTVGLVSTVLGAASGAQNVGTFSAMAAGAYVILGGLWASPVSGASMNPARTLGPDLVRGDLSHTWVYIAGPFAGALLAWGAAQILRGQGGGPTGSLAAQGSLQRTAAVSSRAPRRR